MKSLNWNYEGLAMLCVDGSAIWFGSRDESLMHEDRDPVGTVAPWHEPVTLEGSRELDGM